MVVVVAVHHRKNCNCQHSSAIQIEATTTASDKRDDDGNNSNVMASFLYASERVGAF
jgi:hypothetical protein